MSGELVPLHAATVEEAPSTIKLRAPVGALGPEKLTWAFNPALGVPETIAVGATVTVDVGRGTTVRIEPPLAAL